ncbi:MAG: hypothetical protein U9Q15_04980 [Patescibacteria group bacterium]|nr:hypothetical protein [Patescibacteria group bacterium]
MDNNNKAISSIDVSGDHTTLNSTDSWLDGDAGNIDLVPGAAFTDLNGNTNTTQSGTTFGV